MTKAGERFQRLRMNFQKMQMRIANESLKFLFSFVDCFNRRKSAGPHKLLNSRRTAARPFNRLTREKKEEKILVLGPALFPLKKFAWLCFCKSKALLRPQWSISTMNLPARARFYRAGKQENFLRPRDYFFFRPQWSDATKSSDALLTLYSRFS